VRTLLVTGVAVVAVVGFTVYQAMQARDALNQADQHFEDLTVAVSAGDPSGAQDSLYAAQQATLAAQRNTGGPFWWLASKAPVIGPDVRAARTVADVVDQVAQGVLPTLVDASSSLSSTELQPAHGRIRLYNIQRLAPLVATAHTSLVGDLAQVQALHPDTLMSSIAAPVRQLESKLYHATTVTASASTATQLLPAMLGADGKRTYLVLFQNNAEIRATGGISGSVATLTANHGAIKLTQQGTAAALGTYQNPILRLRRAESELFTDSLGIFPADINFTPDFPRTARLAQAMWKRKTGQTVDGVLSTDPVALSYLLAGTGPITVTGGQQLTASNAIRLLLSQTYLNQPNPDRQNRFFANAAKSVFSGVMAGQGDAHGVLKGILRASDQHRTLVWSDHGPEEALLAPTKLSGAMPRRATASPQVGVYFNDGTGSKMDYYLDYDVKAQPTHCRASGAQKMRLTVTMKSNAPANAATLPVSVIGPGFGAPPGSIRTNVLVYAPFHGKISNARIDGQPAIFGAFRHGGRAVVAQTVDLSPGGSHALTFTLTSGRGQPETPQVQVTPGLPGHATTEVTPPVCK
jgi:hypothetical protein